MAPTSRGSRSIMTPSRSPDNGRAATALVELSGPSQPSQLQSPKAADVVQGLRTVIVSVKEYLDASVNDLAPSSQSYEMATSSWRRLRDVTTVAKRATEDGERAMFFVAARKLLHRNLREGVAPQDRTFPPGSLTSRFRGNKSAGGFNARQRNALAGALLDSMPPVEFCVDMGDGISIIEQDAGTSWIDELCCPDGGTVTSVVYQRLEKVIRRAWTISGDGDVLGNLGKNARRASGKKIETAGFNVDSSAVKPSIKARFRTLWRYFVYLSRGDIDAAFPPGTERRKLFSESSPGVAVRTLDARDRTVSEIEGLPEMATVGSNSPASAYIREAVSEFEDSLASVASTTSRAGAVDAWVSKYRKDLIDIKLKELRLGCLSAVRSILAGPPGVSQSQTCQVEVIDATGIVANQGDLELAPVDNTADRNDGVLEVSTRESRDDDLASTYSAAGDGSDHSDEDEPMQGDDDTGVYRMRSPRPVAKPRPEVRQTRQSRARADVAGADDAMVTFTEQLR